VNGLVKFFAKLGENFALFFAVAKHCITGLTAKKSAKFPQRFAKGILNLSSPYNLATANQTSLMVQRKPYLDSL